MKWSEGQGNIIGEDMLGDKRHQGLGVKRSVQVKEALQSLNWGGLLLVYFGKYRWAKYWMAIACTDITVKLPLAVWLIS